MPAQPTPINFQHSTSPAPDAPRKQQQIIARRLLIEDPAERLDTILAGALQTKSFVNPIFVD